MKAPSNFTVCLTMVIMMIAGAALTTRLNVGFDAPLRQGKTVTVSFRWPGTSARVVEHAATSVIEGVVSRVKDVASVSSASYDGRGRVKVELKKSADVSALRFEITSSIRQIYSKLPHGVTYPSVTGGELVGEDDSNKKTLLLTYNVNANKDEHVIMKQAEQLLAKRLRQVDGVRQVELTGTTDDFIEISYDPNLLATYGVNPSAVKDAVKNFTGRSDIVGDVMKETGGHRMRQTLYLSAEGLNLNAVPVITADGRTVYLGSLVTMERKRKNPDKYFRVNGMNTVYMNVYVDGDANMIALSSRLQKAVDELSIGLTGQLSLSLAFDVAEEESVEVFNLVSRSALSLLMLLLCVWLVNRNWKYFVIISVTLIANILIAVVLYWLFDLRLHVFSMAGITVSMALIIDASIVMADHYGYHHDRSAFLSILAAMLTTIGTLATVVFLPDEWQADLYDFARVIAINLGVSLVVALLFVPALTDTLHYDSRHSVSVGRRRMAVRWNRIYGAYLLLLRRHRWLGCVALVLLFGLPWCALPDEMSERLSNYGFIETLRKYTGGTLQLFVESLDKGYYREEESAVSLTIRGQLPQGGTATELNAKVVDVENLLKALDGVKRFTTSIDGREARIEVEFCDSVQDSFLPFDVENHVISKLISIGGADWATYGVRPMGFSNSLNLQHRGSRIWLKGYNFDMLNAYAAELAHTVENNPRVRDVTVEIPWHENGGEELYVDYDKERMAVYGMDAAQIRSALASMLDHKNVGDYDDGSGRTDVVLTSTKRDAFDRWMMMNSYVKEDTNDVRVADIVDIRSRQVTPCIPKENQEYVLAVAFNVLGSFTYTHDFIEETIEHFGQRLPMGFKCTREQYNRHRDTAAPYWIIAVVAVVIFIICAILFESLLVPLVIVLLIPVSFIGLFLTFWLTGVSFGTGGFASMVMLAGIVVNAGIYIVNEYQQTQISERRWLRAYLKAYNRKIVPVFLTTVSTLFGLVPFFFDGMKESFWFSFATGVCGGLVFSLFAVVFIMPFFFKR